MSLTDVEKWFKNSGKVGDFLYNRYINNPLFNFYGIPKPEGSSEQQWLGRSWVIWDIANIAWLLNPDSVSSSLVKD